MVPSLKQWVPAVAIGLTALVALSVATVTPRPLADQPFPDAAETADSTRHLVEGHGYRTDVYKDTPYPRAPPGYSLALAPFVALGRSYPANAQRGATTYAVLYVVISVVAAWAIGGPIAALLMAAFVGLSPFARTEGGLIMVDALSATLMVLVAALTHRPSKGKTIAAGAVAGALVGVRFQMGLVLLALSLSLPKAFRVRACIGAAPFLAALALYQWATFGNPFHTGYQHVLGDGQSAFGWSYVTHPLSGDGPWIVADVLDGRLLQWICPCPIGGPQAALSNAWFYPAVLLGFFWIYALPFVTAFGFVQLWKRRDQPFARFSALLIAMNLALFTFYFYQGTRFMAGPATLLAIFAACYFAEGIEGTLQTRTRVIQTAAPVHADT